MHAPARAADARRRFAQRLDGVDLESADESCLRGRLGGDDQVSDPSARQGGGHRQDARDGSHLATEGQFPDERDPLRSRPDLLGAEEDPDRHRQVEARPGLAQVGRGQVDRDAARRMDESGVADRAADPFPSLLEGRVRRGRRS